MPHSQSPTSQTESVPADEREQGATTSYSVLLLAALGAAACEATVTAFAAFAKKPSLSAAVVAWFLSFGLTCLAGMPLVLALGFLLDRSSARRLGVALVAGFGRERASVATLMLMTAFAGALGIGIALGKLLVQGLSPLFGAAATSALTLLSLVVLLILVALLVPRVNRLIDFVLAVQPRLERVNGMALVLLSGGLVASAALLLRLGGAYGALPMGTTVGGVLALTWFREALSRGFPDTRRGAQATLGVFALCVPAGIFPGEASPSAQSAVLFAAPYLSVVVAGVEKATDRDGDSHSGLLFGGDCDDSNPAVHPGALEVPGNGVDENCANGDAPSWEDVQAPSTPRPEQVPKKTNVLMIMVDALRPDRLHFAGYDRETSPNLDRFREKATWFKHAYTTAPRTRDALASVFTGNYPARIGIKNGSATHTLPSRATTAAELLKKSGYENRGYTITYVDKRFRKYGQGYSFFKAPWGSKPWQFEWTRAAPLTSKAGIKELNALSSKAPWHLFLHFRCTHDPYYKHEKDFGDSDSDKYDSELHHCDNHIGKVLAAAEARADADRTAIILFSDHGELFGEHGGHYHGETLFEPDVRTLLLAKVPGATQQTVEVPVSLIDLGASVMDLGAQVPKGIDGWSLLPLFFDGTPDPAWKERALFTTTDLWRANIHYAAAAMIAHPYKYIWDMRTGQRELFDVLADPAELQPLDDAARQKSMSELLDGWLASHSPKARSSTK